MRLLLLSLLPLLVFFAGVAVAESDLGAPASEARAAYPFHLDGALTGGFGEETCHSCHFDYDVNNEGGSLSLQGLEEAYRPGERYQLRITVESERLEVGGFQMTARFEDGTQAGTFHWDTDRLTLTPSVSDEVQYVQHSEDGVAPTGEREVTWSLTWKAPERDARPVIFNVAANAGNNDDSAFGDWIYVEELTVEPVPASRGREKR